MKQALFFILLVALAATAANAQANASSSSSSSSSSNEKKSPGSVTFNEVWVTEGVVMNGAAPRFTCSILTVIMSRTSTGAIKTRRGMSALNTSSGRNMR